MINEFDANALLGIISHLIFIAIAWWTLQAIQFEKLLKPNRVFQARILYVFLSVALGSAVSNFFLDYLFLSRQLPAIFQ
ncbi:DUF1146 family protein [Bacillus massilinigeriensis]|uniref:DUF1146 family protein n=1 Tax=Bacillus mediterraneensis TaxID=1805474 RepID=UPI0008F89E37|nr:DUF1146 family protein [Bacillus mediterraneensis]